ncbi:MAG: glutathione peroxidase [Spirochaetia bacterium]|jgi:glutathione peroxidase|nr:glutathione peroxidase [Spirochaetia bacterium]
MNLYKYTVKDRKGQDVALSAYKGKVVLVINTATECGFTPQYAPLEAIYEDLHDKGLEILDFPCNQFGGQAPGTAEEIHEFCTGRFGVKFPQFAKIDVNGDNADPLYKDLVHNTKFGGFDMNHKIAPILVEMLSKADKDYDKKSTIKWNFTKFLFNKEGNLVRRYEPTASLDGLKKDIEALL